MTRVRFAALVAVLTSLALMLPAAAGASSSAQIAMLNKVNAFRQSHGVGKVRLSTSLEHSASSYSRYMMRSGYFGHATRIHASSRYRTLGEIIEIQRGMRAGVSQAFHAWLNSPPHRSVILMGTFKFAGAGVVHGRFHGRRMTIWTMHFGRH